MNIINEIAKKSKKRKNSNTELNILNKRYSYFEEVGRGGLSVVYKGIDIYNEYFRKESKIVIKIPTKDLLKKEDIDAFVYSEYCYLKELSNDNIVRVLDFGIDKKTKIPYLVLDYIEGSLLSEVTLISIDIKVKNRIFKSLIKTLSYIHSKNIVHCDIAPNNIIIKDNYKPVLFDFGISQYSNSPNSISLEFSKIKAINPKYTAPELIENKNEKPTFESDVFSLAVVLYELYTNKQLFQESSIELRNKSIKKKDLSQIPFYLRGWFKKALSIHPLDRKLPKKYIFYI